MYGWLMHGRNLELGKLRSSYAHVRLGQNNRRFCPAAPMKKAPTTVLDSMHRCWDPNWHKTTLKQIQWCLSTLVLGTLADGLSCPVPPPSLVLAASGLDGSSTVGTVPYRREAPTRDRTHEDEGLLKAAAPSLAGEIRQVLQGQLFGITLGSAN